jgi:hypothetical protein
LTVGELAELDFEEFQENQMKTNYSQKRN